MMVCGNKIDQTSTSLSNLIKFMKIIYKVEKPSFLIFNTRQILI